MCQDFYNGKIFFFIFNGNSIQSLFPYKKYTNIKKQQNNKETKVKDI